MKQPRTSLPRRKLEQAKPTWQPEVAVSHTVLKTHVQHGRLDHLLIHETDDQHYWIAIKIKLQRQMKFLATRRDTSRPRLFKRLDVIDAYLRNRVGLPSPWQLKLWTNIHNSRQK